MKYTCLVYLFCCIQLLKAQPGHVFFNHPAVHEIRIQFETLNYFDSLAFYKSQDDASGIEKYLRADVVIDGDSLQDVGIRFRGNSSYGHPGTKKPIQMDMNEFVSGQKYDGLKKINLNNGFLDPSQMREKLFLDVLQEMDLPAPRCTYAAVYFNGNYTGLYKALEPVTKDFLEAHFATDTGNLYRCEPNMPLSFEGNNQSLYYDNCELKTNEGENDWSGLLHFISTVNLTLPEQFEPSLRNIFDLDVYLRTWAANMVFGNLDSYLYLPHNYYLYENPQTGKINWITWDVSLAFGVYAFLVTPESRNFDLEYLPQNAASTRPLNDRCLKNDQIRQQYLARVCEVAGNVFTPSHLFPRIDSLANVLRPYVNAEPDANRMFTPDEFERNLGYGTVIYQALGTIPGLKDFIMARRSNVIKQLCDKNMGCAKGTVIPVNNDVKIYPNPGEVFNIDLAMPSSALYSTYTVTDYMGRNVTERLVPLNEAEVQTLDLSDLPAGIYFLKTSSGCIEKEKRIVVVH